MIVNNKSNKIQKLVSAILYLEKDEFEKSRSGVYSDNSKNRRLKRVGQKYGSSKQEDISFKDKKVEDDNKNEKNKTLDEYARETSLSDLERSIKESKDFKVREAAHKEIARRKNEEEISKEKEVETQELIDKRKKLIEDQSNLRKVSFEEYKSDFKDFTNKPSKECYDFYDTDAEKIKKYKNDNQDEERSLSKYCGNYYPDVRLFLSGKKNYNNLKESSRLDKEKVEKISNDLSNIIKNNKIKENLVLNRRVSTVGESNLSCKEFFEKLKIGSIYEDKSFSSASLRELGIFGNFNIKILVKSGSNVSNIDNKGELEYLIDKGSKFRVLEKSVDNMIVELL